MTPRWTNACHKNHELQRHRPLRMPSTMPALVLHRAGVIWCPAGENTRELGSRSQYRRNFLLVSRTPGDAHLMSSIIAPCSPLLLTMPTVARNVDSPIGTLSSEPVSSVACSGYRPYVYLFEISVACGGFEAFPGWIFPYYCEPSPTLWFKRLLATELHWHLVVR